MKTRIDLHIHSKFSGDTDAEPEELIMQAIKQGLHGIAFTEHYSYEVSEPLEELKEQYKDKVMIFRGVEFSALEGHCLIFGVNMEINSGFHRFMVTGKQPFLHALGRYRYTCRYSLASAG